MNKVMIGLLGLLAVFVIFLIIAVVSIMGTYNQQMVLKNQYMAKVDANKADLSNLKSKLPEAASVTEEQMDQLGKLMTNYAAARTPKSEGVLMNWVKETVPNVDQSTYLNLQNLIIATRDSWTARQKELVDIARVYNTNLDTQPSGLILSIFGHFERIQPIVIVTEGTAKAFETKRDEPIKLFSKP